MRLSAAHGRHRHCDKNKWKSIKSVKPESSSLIQIKIGDDFDSGGGWPLPQAAPHHCSDSITHIFHAYYIQLVL